MFDRGRDCPAVRVNPSQSALPAQLRLGQVVGCAIAGQLTGGKGQFGVSHRLLGVSNTLPGVDYRLLSVDYRLLSIGCDLRQGLTCLIKR